MSIQLIKPNYLVILPPTQHHSFFRNLPPLFHLQTGTRNKTVPYHQFGNNMFHLQIDPSNKTVLNDQFGNNVFHAQIGTRNKTVLIYQLENNMFHSQLGTRNETFLFYTRVNVLCLSCKKPGPLIVDRNTKTRNSRY